MPYTEQDVLDACLDAIVDIAASAAPGEDGTMHDHHFAAIQHVLDMAEDPAALAAELGAGEEGRRSHEPLSYG